MSDIDFNIHWADEGDPAENGLLDHLLKRCYVDRGAHLFDHFDHLTASQNPIDSTAISLHALTKYAAVQWRSAEGPVIYSCLCLDNRTFHGMWKTTVRKHNPSGADNNELVHEFVDVAHSVMYPETEIPNLRTVFDVHEWLADRDAEHDDEGEDYRLRMVRRAAAKGRLILERIEWAKTAGTYTHLSEQQLLQVNRWNRVKTIRQAAQAFDGEQREARRAPFMASILASRAVNDPRQRTSAIRATDHSDATASSRGISASTASSDGGSASDNSRIAALADDDDFWNDRPGRNASRSEWEAYFRLFFPLPLPEEGSNDDGN